MKEEGQYSGIMLQTVKSSIQNSTTTPQNQMEEQFSLIMQPTSKSSIQHLKETMQPTTPSTQHLIKTMQPEKAEQSTGLEETEHSSVPHSIEITPKKTEEQYT